VAGALPAAIAANARDLGLICPKASGAEAAWAGEDIDILAPDNLVQLINHVKGSQVLTRPRPALAEDIGTLPDLRDIKGQEAAKRPSAHRRRSSLMVGLPPGKPCRPSATLHPAAHGCPRMLDVSMIAWRASCGAKIVAAPVAPSPHHSASMPALAAAACAPGPAMARPPWRLCSRRIAGIPAAGVLGACASLNR
jgi:magnesium chelatase family protein